MMMMMMMRVAMMMRTKMHRHRQTATTARLAVVVHGQTWDAQCRKSPHRLEYSYKTLIKHL